MSGPGCVICGEPYNYAGTGLCGPCCTGEADMIGEGVYTGGDDDEDIIDALEAKR